MLLSILVFAGTIAQAADHTLNASPATVVWGYYSAQAKSVLSIHSGDTVRMQTVSTCGSPERLEKAGVPAGDIPQFYRDIYAKVTDKGPGGHILTGPVAIAKAEPDDVLEVRILKVDIESPYACNGFSAGRGFLPDDLQPVQNHSAGSRAHDGTVRSRRYGAAASILRPRHGRSA